MENERVKKRKNAERNRKATVRAVRYGAEFVVLLAAFIFHLNDEFLHFSAIPSSGEVLKYFGFAPEPTIPLESGEAAVYFIDVGQGDCELVLTEEHSVLIDCGEPENVGRILGFLEYAGVESLDMLVVSHPHIDHYGSLSGILQEIPVGTILAPELPADIIPYGITYNRYITAAKAFDVPIRYARAGERYILGDNSYLEIIAPVYNDYPELNDCSVAAKFVHGDTSFLFTGDLQEQAELDLVELNADLDADVLKIGHHGSAGSSTAEFLESVTPKIAVAEASAENSYRHPRTEVIDRLADVGCGTVCTTSYNGNVTVISDGTDLRIFTQKEEPIDLR